MDKEVGDDGGGGIDATTNRQTRDEGSDEEGKDGKDDGNVTALAAMDGSTVTAMDGNDSNGRWSLAAA